MRLELDMAPTVLPVDEADVWTFLRLTLDETLSPPAPVDAADVRSLIDAAVAELDGWDGFLGRCLIEQSWTLYLDGFPRSDLLVPLPPLIAVDAIEYDDTSGSAVTLDPSAYRVAGIGGDGRIVPVTRWPSTPTTPECVRVAFTAGFGDDPAAVPMPIRQWIKDRVADRYGQRGHVTFAHPYRVPGVDDLAAYRVWSL
ncbi:head-tail connector protein [Rhodospira trueperi]|uniref:Phage gp6-like head-tail connector protein n=1 Tax=Rhodospira trueperi TaxID=69960 RepID=A0A1G6X1R9_9PROT|nr:hypothetical protein [Rhodospira trueperi]SDD72019.1 phage conserved hypothetical protein, phiE125 gp8 family [Rhodospira trueperi]